MDNVLKATHRSVIGKQVKAMRREGQIPAVLYGHNIEPTAISLELRNTSAVLGRVSASSLVTINLEGVEHKALVREKQRNFLTGSLLHVDFHVVSMTEKLHTEVALELVGEAPAVKIYGGNLVTNLDTMEIECLPGDLPRSIKVDISVLKQIGDTLRIADLVLPSGVVSLDDEDAVVVVVTAPEAEEVAEEATAEPEVVLKGKKEEED